MRQTSEAPSAPLVAGSSTCVIKGSQYSEYGFTLDAFLPRRSLAGDPERLRLLQYLGYVLRIFVVDIGLQPLTILQVVAGSNSPPVRCSL